MCGQPTSITHATTHLLLCLADDSQRDRRAEITDAREAWVHQPRGALAGVERRGERNGRLLDHAVRDVARLGEDRPKPDAGKNVHVVALARFVTYPVMHHGLVRAAGRINDLAVGPETGVSEANVNEHVAHHATASG